jgi:hypothetical protein
MTEAEAAAQAELRRIVEELDAIRSRLTDVHARLPVPPAETAVHWGEEEADAAAQIRSVIECVLADSLRPAIRDLAAAARFRPESEEG